MGKAIKGLRRINKPQTLAMVKDKLGDYDGVIRLLIKHKCITEALKYAAKYEAEKHPISKVHQVHYLASHQAEKLANRLQNETTFTDFESFPPADEMLLQQFETVLKYLPRADQVDHFKSAGMHDKACEVLTQEEKYDELYRIYTAQGWHEEGVQLAKQQKNRKREADFILFKASAELEENKELTPATLEMLKKKRGTGSESEVKASLLYGMGMQNPTMLWSAYQYYKRNNISIGQVEALSATIGGAKYDEQSQKWKNIHLERNEDIIDQVISACREIRIITDALTAKEPNTVQNQMLLEIESFYGLHMRVFDTMKYSIPPSSYCWTNELLKEADLQDMVKDSDGMLQLKLEPLRKAICNRLQMFVKKWIIDDELNLVQNFNKALVQHPLHKQMLSGGYLTSYSGKSLNFQQYFDMLSQAYNITHYGNIKLVNEAETLTAVLSTVSPQATCYLPVSSLKVKSDPLIQRLHEQGSHVLAENDGHFVFDQWYEAWRINCVTKKGENFKMKDVLSTRSAHHNSQTNKAVDSGGFQRQRSQDIIPPVYVLDGSCEYKHLILLWITTCELVRKKRMLPACTITVRNVIRHIALTKSIWTTVSVTNLLHIHNSHNCHFDHVCNMFCLLAI